MHHLVRPLGARSERPPEPRLSNMPEINPNPNTAGSKSPSTPLTLSVKDLTDAMGACYALDTGPDPTYDPDPIPEPEE